jgi:2'-hydroxyisoflavone reductase
MPMDRRQFVTASISAAGLSTIPGLLSAAVFPAKQKLNILVLGGTGFLGPHTVQYALDRGHEVTLFNRGKTNSDMFPQLETIIGDRDPDVDKGLSGLENRQWDAVIDNSGFVPRITGASSGLLADNVSQYLFVSTICQYDNWMEGRQFRTEVIGRGTLEDPTTEDVSTHYCALKAYCELAVEAAMPGRVTQIRPGLIVGPRDGTDRFTYWPMRADRGGEMLAPGKPSDLTQFIDVRDLSKFMVHCVEQNLIDDYNVVRQPMPIGEILNSCVDVTGQGSSLTWIPADFLAEHGLESWRQLQMWADSESPLTGSLTWSSTKAMADGLTIRSVDETVRDTVAWFKSLPEERRSKLRSGVEADKEKEVLQAWHTSQPG